MPQSAGSRITHDSSTDASDAARSAAGRSPVARGSAMEIDGASVYCTDTVAGKLQNGKSRTQCGVGLCVDRALKLVAPKLDVTNADLSLPAVDFPGATPNVYAMF